MLAIRLSFLLTALALGATSVLAGGCSSDNQCPKSKPCCSQYGFCGSTKDHCLSGCDPLGSFTHGSCAPLPKCKNQHLDFTNSKTHHVSGSSYNGDPNAAPMTLEGGKVRPGKGGLKLTVEKNDSPGGGGTSLSTTRYMYYGRTTVNMRHANHKGIVASFIVVSPTKDEIDWEMTTADKKNAQTNWYFHWSGDTAPLYDYGENAPVSKDFTTADWHAYTIDWSPTEMVFEIDGKPVRTVKRSSTKNKQGAYDYPATPSRIQVSIWDSDGMPKGTRDWAGGRPDWSKADSTGAFTAEIKSIDIQCADPDLHKDYTAYAFSSKMDSTTGQPKVIGTKKSPIVS